MNILKKKMISQYASNGIFISMLILVVLGSLMIVSATMPQATNETNILLSTGLKQFLYVIIGLIAFFFFMNFNILIFRKELFYLIYIFILFSLLITRLFGSLGGAYGWILIGPISIQPSEFAKIFIILLAAKLFGNDLGKEKNIHNLKRYMLLSFIYFLIIAGYQKDFGSGVVLFIVSYCAILVPPYKEYRKIQNIMILIIILVIALAILALSPMGTAFLSNLSNSNYMIARFLSSANPFKYLYDDGYHLVMSLVSFASGGLFGLGYGNSIHKYMNFPNPTSDFILPVIVEELGLILGLLPIILFYGIIFYNLIHYSIRFKKTSSKIISLCIFMYLASHFIFNVGGVSGLIPLTGIPLLMLSSGGSSLIACMMSLGICENEIIKHNKEKL